jgi:pyruvate dehydrogenase E1 component alpha subunit
MVAEVTAEIDRAVAFAEAAALEPVEDLTRFVHSERPSEETVERRGGTR